MAKIGNEARLILKLAEAREPEVRRSFISFHLKCYRQASEKEGSFVTAVELAFKAYRTMLQEVIAELEER